RTDHRREARPLGPLVGRTVSSRFREPGPRGLILADRSPGRPRPIEVRLPSNSRSRGTADERLLLSPHERTTVEGGRRLPELSEVLRRPRWRRGREPPGHPRPPLPSELARGEHPVAVPVLPLPHGRFRI